jgi:hypothetical protein
MVVPSFPAKSWKRSTQKIDMFWGVLFGGDGAGTLKEVTDKMGDKGQFRNPTDLNGLVNEYVEIAKLS